MKPSDRSLWLLYGLLGLTWGSSYLFIKIGVESLGPFTLVSLRLLFAGLFLGAVVLAAREPLPRSRTALRHFLVMGTFGIFVPFSLITWGEVHVSSGLASVLNATTPLFTIVFAALLLGDEPLRANRVVGLLVGFAGVAVVTSPTLSAAAAPGDELAVAGDVAIIAASASYAISAVYARRFVEGMRPMTIALGQVVVGFVLATAAALLFERPMVDGFRPEAALAVVWLGVLGSGLALLLFYRLLANWGATRTQTVTYLLPPVGVILGVVVLHERLDLSVVLGTALIVGGVALVNAQAGVRRFLGRARAATTLSHD